MPTKHIFPRSKLILLFFAATIINQTSSQLSSHNFCSPFPITVDPIQLTPNDSSAKWNFSLPNSSNGSKLTTSLFFKLNDMTSSEMDLFKVKMIQNETDQQNPNFQDFFSVSLWRNPNEADQGDSIRVNAPSSLKDRQVISLDVRVEIGKWYYLVVSFDFERKKRYVSLQQMGAGSSGRVIRLTDAPDVSISLAQKFEIGLLPFI